MQLLAPLVVMPLIFSNLVTSQVANWAVILSAYGVLHAVVEWGFPLFAVREVEKSYLKEERLSKIVTIMLAQLLIYLIAVPMFSLFLFFYYSANVSFLFLLISFSLVFQMAVPQWLFQIEKKLSHYALIVITNRIAWIASIIIGLAWFPNIYYLIFSFMMSWFVSGIAFHTIRGSFAKSWFLNDKNINIREIFLLIKANLNLFAANASSVLYTGGYTLLIGRYLSENDIAQWFVLERLLNVSKQLMTPIIQTYYPVSIRLTQTSSRILTTHHAVIFLMMALVSSVSLILLAKFGSFFVEYLGLESSLVPLIYLLSAIPVLVAGSNVLGVHVIAARGFDKQFRNAIIISAILSVPLCSFLVSGWSLRGAIFGQLLTEFLVCALTAFYMWRLKFGNTSS